MIYMIKLFI